MKHKLILERVLSDNIKSSVGHVKFYKNLKIVESDITSLANKKIFLPFL